MAAKSVSLLWYMSLLATCYASDDKVFVEELLHELLYAKNISRNDVAQRLSVEKLRREAEWMADTAERLTVDAFKTRQEV